MDRRRKGSEAGATKRRWSARWIARWRMLRRGRWSAMRSSGWCFLLLLGPSWRENTSKKTSQSLLRHRCPPRRGILFHLVLRQSPASFQSRSALLLLLEATMPRSPALDGAAPTSFEWAMNRPKKARGKPSSVTLGRCSVPSTFPFLQSRVPSHSSLTARCQRRFGRGWSFRGRDPSRLRGTWWVPSCRWRWRRCLGGRGC